MSLSAPLTLTEQRQLLRQRLQLQRTLIAHLLAPASPCNQAYPRSHTLRLLTQQPVLAAQLLTQVATLFGGARLVRTLSSALLVARVLRMLAIQRRQRLLRERPIAEV